MLVTKDSPNEVQPSLEMSLTYCQHCGLGSAASHTESGRPLQGVDGPY